MSQIRKRINKSITHIIGKDLNTEQAKENQFISNSRELNFIIQLWEENMHKGGQSLGEVKLPEYFLKNDSKLWENEELINILTNGIFLR